MQTEALRLALEAFNKLAAWNDGEVGSHMDEPYSAEVAREAIAAIKAALEAKDEPVAWGVFEVNLHDMFFSQEEAQEMAELKGTHAEVRPLYATSQRTWVGLTEQQIKILLSDSKCWIGDDCSMPNLTYIIRAVEKAHGIG